MSVDGRLELLEAVQAKLIRDLSDRDTIITGLQRDMAAMRRDMMALRNRNVESRLRAVEYQAEEAKHAYGAELQVHEFMNHYRSHDDTTGNPYYTHGQ